MTIRVGATPSGLILYAGCPSCCNPTSLSWLGTGTGTCWTAYPRGLVVQRIWCRSIFVTIRDRIAHVIRLGMWPSSNTNAVGFCQFFAKLKSDRFSDSFGFGFRFHFGEPTSTIYRNPPLAIKVNKYTVNSYLLTSVQNKHRIGLELLVRFGV